MQLSERCFLITNLPFCFCLACLKPFCTLILYCVLQVCKWCSNCPVGMCVRHEANCEQANPCQRQQTVIDVATECVERVCQASDCDKCWAHGNCIWTRQFKRSSMCDWSCLVNRNYVFLLS